MRNLNLYFWLIALAGMITSCSRDEAAGPQNNESNRVRIGTSIDQALRTRAPSVTVPANHQLRYVLEVWDTETPSSLVYRDEKVTKEAPAVVFDFVLTEAGDYKAMVWADFIPKSETGSEVATPNNYTHYADHHYVTNTASGLKAVALAKTGMDYVINDDARDAFFACIAIKKETGALEKDVELKRPFGQINIIEKNTALLDKVQTMTLAYTVPGQFNVETGTTEGAWVDAKPAVSTLPTATADRKANLFYDFIFAPAIGQTTLGEIALEFVSNNEHITLPPFTIPANMPVVRNKRTNISGSILQANSNDVKLTVAVSDGWTTPADKQDLDVPAARVVLDAAKTAGSGNDATQYTYVITTAEQLAALATLTNITAEITGSTGHYCEANYLLANDINLENNSWTPIGGLKDFFGGVFDGQGHTIRNLNVNIQTTDGEIYAGLFGAITGNIRNLIVEGKVTVSGASACFAGGICASMMGPTASVEFCRFNGSVSSTTSANVLNRAGGIIGSGTTLEGCIVDATVTISGGSLDLSAAGGLAGSASVKASYSMWNSNKTSTGIGIISAADVTECNGFTDITGLNNLLSGINDGVPTSTYVWQAGATATDYPTLQKRNAGTGGSDFGNGGRY